MATDAVFSKISPILLGMIREIKFTCANKERGCPESLKIDQMHKHELIECKFKEENLIGSSIEKACKICSDEIAEGLHYCSKVEREWCPDHQKKGLYLTSDRIANTVEVQRYLEVFKCRICLNLVRHP